MSTSPQNTKPITQRERAPFLGTFLGAARQMRAWSGWDNAYQQRATSATSGNDPIPLIGTDSQDNPLVNGGYYGGFATELRFNVSANGKLATAARFFTNFSSSTPLEIVAVKCIYTTAAGATSTGYISKEKAGQTPGSGTSIMSGTFNLNTTTNTLQSGTLASTLLSPTMTLSAGEHLTMNISAVGSLAGVQVIVYVRPHSEAGIAQWFRTAAADVATGTMYLNVIPGQVIRGIAVSSSAQGTDAGAVTLDVTKDTSTNAPGAGTSVLASTVNLKTITVNTGTYPTLATSTATLTMAAGDRLAVKITGTPTAVTDLVVTVFFQPTATDHKIIPVSFWDAPATDRSIFIADGSYIVADYHMTWSTASTSVFAMLTKDTSTNAPGAGTDLLTDNTNQGIDTNATANTPVGSLLLSAVSTKPTLWLAPGDRLGVDFTGTAGSLAGVFGVVVLRRA